MVNPRQQATSQTHAQHPRTCKNTGERCVSWWLPRLAPVPLRRANWYPKEHHSFSINAHMPRRVRYSGSSIIWANDVSWDVRSQPSLQCTSTEIPLCSKLATRTAPAKTMDTNLAASAFVKTMVSYQKRIRQGNGHQSGDKCIRQIPRHKTVAMRNMPIHAHSCSRVAHHSRHTHATPATHVPEPLCVSASESEEDALLLPSVVVAVGDAVAGVVPRRSDHQRRHGMVPRRRRHVPVHTAGQRRRGPCGQLRHGAHEHVVAATQAG